MKLYNLGLGLAFFILAQTGAYYQSNGQFIFPWFKNNPWLISLFGVPISYFYIQATKNIAIGFEGIIWPARLLGFAIGIIIFSVLTYIHLNEPITTKTMVMLLLAITIVLIQIFWK